MRYSALADSKCIRAGLVFASGNLNSEISNAALIDMATGIELMHTYSLIHDDLPSMDNDEMRRGQASNHIKLNDFPHRISRAKFYIEKLNIYIIKIIT